MKLNSWLLIAIISILCFILISNAEIISDEVPHSQQIHQFINGNYSLVYYLTVIPGYHMMIAGISKLLFIDSLAGFRGINAALTIFFFMFVIYMISKDKFRALQAYFFPLFFVFYFLVYTDLISMLFILIGYYYYKKEQYWLNGFFLGSSILIRQNNIIWLVAFCTLIAFEFKFKLSFIFKKAMVHLLFGAGFVLFVILNNFKIVLGTDSFRHPIGFYPSNIYFFLFMITFLFFPVIITDFIQIIDIIKKKWVILIGLLLVGLGSYSVTHPYNQWTDFLRNRILIWSTLMPLNTILFMLIALIGGLWLWNILNKDIILFLFGFIMISMSWLIEIRYYFILFGFILINRPIKNKKIEHFMLYYWAIFALIMFFGAVKHNLFW